MCCSWRVVSLDGHPVSGRDRILDRCAERRAAIPRYREHDRARGRGPAVGREGRSLRWPLCRHRWRLLRRMDCTVCSARARRDHGERSQLARRRAAFGRTARARRAGASPCGPKRKSRMDGRARDVLRPDRDCGGVRAVRGLLFDGGSIAARRAHLVAVGHPWRRPGAGAQRPCQRGRAAVAHAPGGVRACGKPLHSGSARRFHSPPSSGAMTLG